MRRGIVLETGPRPIGLVGHLEDFAVGLYAVDAHAADTDEQVLLACRIACRGPAADMGEFFAVLEHAPGKANDLAVAVDRRGCPGGRESCLPGPRSD